MPTELPELSLWEAALRLGLAAVLAGAIGFERERREQEAGLRTHILVALGSALFMIVGAYAWDDFALGQDVGAIVDPSRIASYVVAGIGFLGGGAILKYGPNITGLTTAASIWATAAIGIAVGIGMYGIALVTAALVVFSLWPLRALARRAGIRPGFDRRLIVHVAGRGSVSDVLAAAERAGVDVLAIRTEERAGGRTVELVVADPAEERRGPLVDAVARVAHVEQVEWAR